MPFSGKSTLARTYEDKEGWVLVERDKIIPKITKTQEWQNRVLSECGVHNIDPSNLRATFPIRNAVTLDMLNAEVLSIASNTESNIFYDGTNLQKHGRQVLLRSLPEDIEVHGVFFDVPKEELVHRAEQALLSGKRKGQHNADAINRIELMWSMMDVPNMEEGFCTLKTYSELQREKTREAVKEHGWRFQ